MSFKVTISGEELQKRKLFVATPMFGGMCQGVFLRSMVDLATLCKHYGVSFRLYLLFNESLIPRARNYAADEFLRSGDTHFMFIDADIGFNPNDVLSMLAMQSDESPYDVLCGPYPKKCISWEKIKTAVDKGVGDENPENLAKYVGDYVFNPANGTNQISLQEPAEILEGGTGFMMIRRKTFENFAKAYPEQSYKPDHVRTANFDGSREIMAYFDCPIDHKLTHLNTELEAFLKKNPKATGQDVYKWTKDIDTASKTYSKRYLSEDYMFCQWVRNIGMKIWLCPWMELQHVGTFTYGGSLKDLASIGQVATADPGQLKKNKN